MGVFFYTNSVALIEDLPLEEEYESEELLRTEMEAGFQQVSIGSFLWSVTEFWTF